MVIGGSGKTYEMLWDCRYCGARKNLGKTHRHCPNCGAPQDATERYFPAENEKVAVEHHAFVGADIQCRACAFWNGRASTCCGNCGSQIQDGREVQRRHDQIAGPGGFQGEVAAMAQQEHLARAAMMGAHGAQGAPGATPPGAWTQQHGAGLPPRKRGPSRVVLVGLGIGGILLAVVACIVTAMWTKDATLAVVAQTWTREIAVESFQTVRDSSWCDATPADARDVSRRRDVRSHKEVRDGETCSNQRVDNGDGTYSERRECTPTYREEPVYDDKCHYTVDRWRTVRTARASGTHAETPSWPRVDLACTGNRLGCEREGPRTEEYVVRLQDTASGKADDCVYDEARWRQFQAGKSMKGRVRVVTDGVECDSLVP
jgi:hypothetical protein